MTKHTPNRNYLIPDEAAEPPESGRYAFTALVSAVTAIDFDIQAILEALAQKSSKGHGHQISDVEGLAGALDSKMSSSRVFKLDDLSDVEGAEGAQEGYILVKTLTGWLPQSALAAVGNHEHTIEQVFGLSTELAARASLGSNGKVLPEQLPALTTTTTVGAALAGASGKSVPDDGDRFSGVLAGGSTVFWTTWAGIKAALAALFVGKAGDTMTGNLMVKASGKGGVRLNLGDTNPGYVEFLKSDGARAGYVGYTHGGNRINYSAEGGNVGHHFNGDMLVDGVVYAGGGGNGRLNTDGNVYGSAFGNQWLTSYIEGRAGAYANNCVQNGQMAGNIEGSILANQTQTVDLHYGSYVCTRVFKVGQGQWGLAFGFRQPQLYVPNRGWFAAFPY